MVDVASVLMEVVAERTGYPLDILEPEMDLEADLGIDSIKRVEILSLLRQRVAGLAEVSATEMVRLRSLGEIAARFATIATGSAATRPPSSVPSAPSVPLAMSSEVPSAIPHAEPHEQPRTAPYASTAPPNEGGRELDVPAPTLLRSVTEVIETSSPGLEVPGLRDGTLIVVDGGSGVAGDLAERLERHGIRARVSAAADIGSEADGCGLIFLGGLRPVGSTDDAIEVNRQAFQTVRTAAAWFAGRAGVLVMVQDTGGDFGLRGAADERAWLGGLAGLARTAAKEWSAAQVKVVDCERGGRGPDELADALAAELLGGGTARDVGLRANGTRWTLRETPLPLAAEPARSNASLATSNSVAPGLVAYGPLTSESAAPGSTAPGSVAPGSSVTPGSVALGSVIVATGGARGVTAAALIALARAHHPTFVLIGRTELATEDPALADAADERELRHRLATRFVSPGAVRPGPADIGRTVDRIMATREVRATVAALEAAGSVVRYVPVDIRDAGALTSALARVRSEIGPITGLVHASGVLADARLESKTDDAFDQVFDTKVEGLRALLAATESDPLDLVCMFSSVAGRFGNSGQSDYAMANEVLAQVASTVNTRRPDCLVRSIAWGPWNGGMVGPELRDHFLGNGVGLIPLADGAAAFVREIESGPGAVRVTLTAGDRSDALGAGPSRRLPQGVVHVSSLTHPYLFDHQIAGVPVLPMALALEWITGVARTHQPDATALTLHDVTVLHGVRLPGLADVGHRLVIHGAPDAADASRLSLELAGADGRPHYRATAVLTPESVQPSRDWPFPIGIRSSGARTDPYDGDVLFHGPAFHVLTEVQELSASRAAALVSGVRSLGWPASVANHAWHTDPAALDAGLQLALLWAGHVFEGAFLPMGAAEVRVHRFGPVAGPARCLLLARDPDPLRPLCDVALLDDRDELLAELLGVALVRRPDRVSAGLETGS